jgi:hypothetical protein
MSTNGDIREVKEIEILKELYPHTRYADSQSREKSMSKVLEKALNELRAIEGDVLGSVQKVLVLFSGICAEAKVLLKLLDSVSSITCADINEELLAKGVAEIRRDLEATNKEVALNTIACNLLETECIGRIKQLAPFDLITIMGSSLSHVSVIEFSSLVPKIMEMLRDGGYLMLQQFDVLSSIYYSYELRELKRPFVISDEAVSREGRYFFFTPLKYRKEDAAIVGMLLTIDNKTGKSDVKPFTWYVHPLAHLRAILEVAGFKVVTVLEDEELIIVKKP